MKAVKLIFVVLALSCPATFTSSTGAAQSLFDETQTFSEQERTPNPIRCGTRIDWIEDNELAFAEARRTGKLVYVLHLSGNLKNSTFT